MTRRHSSTGASSKSSRIGVGTPALLNATCSPPWAATANWTIAAQES